MKSQSQSPLYRFDEPFEFEEFHPDQVQPVILDLIEAQRKKLAELEGDNTATWEGLVAPLLEMVEPLNFAWRIVKFLMGGMNTPELRTAMEAVQPEVVAVNLSVLQSRPLYEGLVLIKDSSEWPRLSDAQRRVIDLRIRDAELAGVGLEREALERFKQIQTQLAELKTRFQNNVLDSTKEFELILTDPAEVDGLPESALAAAANSASQAGHEASPATGPWRISLEGPSYLAFLAHSARRDLREKVYRAMVTRASHGEFDNLALIKEILALRREEADLLGFPTFADRSVAEKMAPGVDDVRKLEASIREVALPKSQKELEELAVLARDRTGDKDLEIMPWDVSYWQERLKESRFDFTQEQLRPFFPLPQVLDGLFDITRQLFGISIQPMQGGRVWHPDVLAYRLTDESGDEVAQFYLDAYSRPETKRPGAWASGALDRKRNSDRSVRNPVAYLTCNQTPPLDGKPSLMTFLEVRTLFHEFGHGLQHMLTTVDIPEVAGMNRVEWDAVELSSQFMENWCWQKPVLQKLARHYETKEPISSELLDKLLATRTFLSGLVTQTQVYYGTLDLEVHSEFAPTKVEDIIELESKVAAANSPLKRIPESRFLCGFAHIFSGGYAAGYYSYLWAEVLSADAFQAFVEAGLEHENAISDVGRRYRDSVLALGGSMHPMAVYRLFRGRDPEPDALLIQKGLVPN